jgi:quercetin dioxygenase-like cupin family protein
MKNWGLLSWILLLLCAAAVAQDSSMVMAAAKTSKFQNLPGVPPCMTVAVQRGDPSKGPSALLLKFTAGCVVPWHWHTAGENLVLVSGKGKAEIKDGKPSDMNPGDYAYLPGKMVHQFIATTAVLLYDMPDGAFDIHYVNKEGTEIPPDEALKPAAGKKAAAKPAPKR